jgi:drug/metabolite transporter (DMT)-like permease
MNIALFFAAYRQTTVAIAVLSHYLTPILVALVAPRLVGEKGTPRSLVAMVLGFVGLALVLEPWRGQVQEGDRLGALLGAGSAVFYTANVMLQKRLAGAFTTNQVLAYHGFVAVPVLAMMVPQESLLHWDGRGMATLVLGALGPGALAGVAFLVGLRRIPASHASTLTFLEPLVAVLVGVLVFREPLGLWGILGSVGILVGGILVVTDRPAPAAEASIRGERSSQGVAK